MSARKTATPRCPHFGACGGCQHQDLAYDEQLRLKQSKLEEILTQTGIDEAPPIAIHAAEPYEYRNRIRLRLETVDGTLRFGYNRPASTDFLPIVTCSIAAPALWHTAEAILSASAERDVAFWLNATAEVELFCDATQSRAQATFFCAPRTKTPPVSQPGNFASAFALLQKHMPPGIALAGAGAAAFDPRTGPTGRLLAEAGSPGLNYKVADETYWITRGGFFQINRFLLEPLVSLVCDGRSGSLAWDLFAGVGLFSRVLAHTFAHITAVESNSSAASDLRIALAKLSPTHTAVEATTLAFLQTAITQRERPDLIVLDPPRAGASTEVCELLNRIAAPSIIYVSCDPTTLARDLSVLQSTYTLTALHLLDLFPQTNHQETIAILQRSH